MYDQKAIRVIFGDREKYIDKLKTCFRARPFSKQKLTSAFFIKEHTKPLFNKHKLKTLQNLCFYHSCCDVFENLIFFLNLNLFIMIYLISQIKVIEAFTSTHLNQVILSSI